MGWLEDQLGYSGRPPSGDPFAYLQQQPMQLQAPALGASMPQAMNPQQQVAQATQQQIAANAQSAQPDFLGQLLSPPKKEEPIQGEPESGMPSDLLRRPAKDGWSLGKGLGGAASGAAAGSAFGPWGTAIGGGIGFLGSLL